MLFVRTPRELVAGRAIKTGAIIEVNATGWVEFEVIPKTPGAILITGVLIERSAVDVGSIIDTLGNRTTPRHFATRGP